MNVPIDPTKKFYKDMMAYLYAKVQERKMRDGTAEYENIDDLSVTIGNIQNSITSLYQELEDPSVSTSSELLQEFISRLDITGVAQINLNLDQLISDTSSYRLEVYDFINDTSSLLLELNNQLYQDVSGLHTDFTNLTNSVNNDISGLTDQFNLLVQNTLQTLNDTSSSLSNQLTDISGELINVLNDISGNVINILEDISGNLFTIVNDTSSNLNLSLLDLSGKLSYTDTSNYNKLDQIIIDTSSNITTYFNNKIGDTSSNLKQLLDSSSSSIIQKLNDTSSYIITKEINDTSSLLKNIQDTSSYIINKESTDISNTTQNIRDTSSFIVQKISDSSSVLVTKISDTSSGIISRLDSSSSNIIQKISDTSSYLYGDYTGRIQTVNQKVIDTSSILVTRINDTSSYLLNKELSDITGVNTKISDASSAITNRINNIVVDLTGGTANKILAKNSNADFDFIWVDQSGIIDLSPVYTKISDTSSYLYSDYTGRDQVLNQKIIDTSSTLNSRINNIVNDLTGGNTNQVLSKNSNADYDYKWTDVSSSATVDFTPIYNAINDTSNGIIHQLGDTSSYLFSDYTGRDATLNQKIIDTSSGITTLYTNKINDTSSYLFSDYTGRIQTVNQKVIDTSSGIISRLDSSSSAIIQKISDTSSYLYSDYTGRDATLNQKIIDTSSGIISRLDSSSAAIITRINDTSSYLFGDYTGRIQIVNQKVSDTSSGIISRLDSSSSAIIQKISDTSSYLFSDYTGRDATLNQKIIDTSSGIISRLDSSSGAIITKIGDTSSYLVQKISDTSSYLYSDYTGRDQVLSQRITDVSSTLSSSITTVSNAQVIDRAILTDINRFGFVNRADTSLTFDGTGTITLNALNTTWTYLRSSIPYTITGSKSKAITGIPTTGTYYVYIDGTSGDLLDSTSAWSFDSTKVFVATLMWNDTLTPKYQLMDERHTCTIDRTLHKYLHQTEGTKYISGGDISGYVIPGGNPSGNTDNTFAIPAITIADEDIFHSLDALSDPNGITTDYTIFKRDASNNWTWVSSNVPYLYSATFMYWDNNGVDTTGINNRYYNTYLLYTSISGTGRFVIIQGRGEYNSLALAQAESISNFTFTGFPISESVAVYQLTWLTGNFTTSGKCKLAATPKRISTSITSASVSVAGIGSMGYQDYNNVNITGGTITGTNVNTILLDFTGGNSNQVLAKNSNTDYDYKWVDQSGGIGTIPDPVIATVDNTNTPYSVLGTEDDIILNAETTNVVATLPSTASVTTGHRILFKRGDGTANTATINTDGSDIFEDGTTSYSLSTLFQYVELMAVPGAWVITASGPNAAVTSNVVTDVSGTYTALTTDNTITCNATSAGFTVNLYTAIGNSGKILYLKKTDATTNVVTLDAFGSQTIDGNLTWLLEMPGEFVILQSNNSNWIVLAD